MTRAWFDQQMARLAGLRFQPADLLTHWEALNDLPESALESAVSRAQRRMVDFPTPYELRVEADAARSLPSSEAIDRGTDLDTPRDFVARLEASGASRTVRVTREWRYFCEHCNDSGSRSLWCGDLPQRAPWWTPMVCGRRADHDAHEWVDACPCASTNPDIQRRKAAQAKFATVPTKRRQE